MDCESASGDQADTPSHAIPDVRAVQPLLKEALAPLKSLIRHRGHMTPDWTHQLRIATRRADVALRLFEPNLHRRRTSDLRQQLRCWRHAAGTLRDLDVLRARCASDAVTPRDGIRLSADLQRWLLPRIDRQRSRARHKLRRLQKHSERRRFIRKMRRLIRHRPRPSDAGSAGLNGLVAAFLQEIAAPPVTLAQSHQTRIAARRLRYALELLQASLPETAQPLIDDLVELQDRLGRINDLAVATRFLKEQRKKVRDRRLQSELEQVGRDCELLAASRLEILGVDWSRLRDTSLALQQARSGGFDNLSPPV